MVFENKSISCFTLNDSIVLKIASSKQGQKEFIYSEIQKHTWLLNTGNIWIPLFYSCTPMSSKYIIKIPVSYFDGRHPNGHCFGCQCECHLNTGIASDLRSTWQSGVFVPSKCRISLLLEPNCKINETDISTEICQF